LFVRNRTGIESPKKKGARAPRDLTLLDKKRKKEEGIGDKKKLHNGKSFLCENRCVLQRKNAVGEKKGVMKREGRGEY